MVEQAARKKISRVFRPALSEAAIRSAFSSSSLVMNPPNET
jgi:hypothetical protein